MAKSSAPNPSPRLSLGMASLLVGPAVALGVAQVVPHAEAFDPGHLLAFAGSLGFWLALALGLMGRAARRSNAQRALRVILLGLALVNAILLHKLVVSPFLEPALRSDLLVAAFGVLAWVLLVVLDPHRPAPESGVAPAGGAGALGVLRMGSLWGTLVLVALVLNARRSGWQGRYRDQVLRGLAGYPESEASASLWGFEPLAQGLEFQWPMAVLADPDEESVVYVLERAGRLQRVDLASSPPTQSTMLDLRSQVGPIDGELGALGVAFHPESSSWTNTEYQYVYVYYTAQSAGQLSNRLSRFDVDWKAERIDAASELILIDQFDRDFWHNGGGLAFGLDGFLYLGMGDEGGSQADSLENSQRLDQNLFSGVLRLDVDRRGGSISHAIRRQPQAGRTQHYFIPSDNPFVGQPDALEEFWALGLRNPSRLSFDKQNGELWLSDVGGSLYEEINVVARGANLGWAYREGPRRLSKTPAQLHGVPSEPRFAYEHEGFRVCVIGGEVYRDSKHPELRGAYLYADYGSGEVFALRSENGRAIQNLALSAPLANLHLQLASLQVVHGEVLVTSLSQSQVYRLVPLGDAGSGSAGLSMPAPEAFQVLCTRCHGAGGVPVEAAAELAQRSARNLTDPAWQDSVDDAHIERIIRDGGAVLRPDSAMPAWKGALSEELIEELVQVIRGFRRAE